MRPGFLRLLVVVWLAMLALRLADAWQRTTPHEPVTPQSLDAVALAQRDRTEAGVAPSGAPAMFLQLGLVQIAARGLDEALLCAHELKVRVGVRRSIEMQFGTLPDDLVRKQGRPSDALVSRAEAHGDLPASFGRLGRFLRVDLAWEGEAEGLHLLQVFDDQFAHTEPGGRGCGGLTLPSVALVAGEPWVYPRLDRGCALVVRLATEPAPEGLLGTIGFWHRACAPLANAPVREGGVTVPELARVLGVKVETQPIVVADPFASAAYASVLFRDEGMAAAVRAQSARWSDRAEPLWPEMESMAGFLRRVWLRGRMAVLPSLLGDRGVMPWSVGEYDFANALGWRCLLLQDDPRTAAAVADLVLQRLRTNALFVDVVHYERLETSPAVQAAWLRLHAAAIDELGVPWSVVFHAPWCLGIYLLLPFLLAACVACVRWGRVPDEPLSRAALVFLGLTDFVTLGGVALQPLFALAVWYHVVRSLRSRPATCLWARLFVWLACAATMFGAMHGTRFGVQQPLLDAFAAAGSSLAWILVGWRLAADRTWRAPQWFAAFLVLQGIVGLVAPAPTPDPAPAGQLVWLAVATIACFVVFLVAGRSTPAEAPLRSVAAS